MKTLQSRVFLVVVLPFNHFKYTMPLPSLFLLRNQLITLWEFPCILFVVVVVVVCLTAFIKDLNVKLDTIKLLEENIGSTFSHISLRNILFDPSLRVMGIKAEINKWDLIKLQRFYTENKSTDKWKDNLLNETRYLQTTRQIKGLIFII